MRMQLSACSFLQYRTESRSFGRQYLIEKQDRKDSNSCQTGNFMQAGIFIVPVKRDKQQGEKDKDIAIKPLTAPAIKAHAAASKYAHFDFSAMSLKEQAIKLKEEMITMASYETEVLIIRGIGNRATVAIIHLP